MAINHGREQWPINRGGGGNGDGFVPLGRWRPTAASCRERKFRRELGQGRSLRIGAGQPTDKCLAFCSPRAGSMVMPRRGCTINARHIANTALIADVLSG